MPAVLQWKRPRHHTFVFLNWLLLPLLLFFWVGMGVIWVSVYVVVVVVRLLSLLVVAPIDGIRHHRQRRHPEIPA